jgi:hypothetical protein
MQVDQFDLVDITYSQLVYVQLFIYLMEEGIDLLLFVKYLKR